RASPSAAQILAAIRGSVRRVTVYVVPMVSYNCPLDTDTAPQHVGCAEWRPDYLALWTGSAGVGECGLAVGTRPRSCRARLRALASMMISRPRGVVVVDASRGAVIHQRSSKRIADLDDASRHPGRAGVLQRP